MVLSSIIAADSAYRRKNVTPKLSILQQNLKDDLAQGVKVIHTVGLGSLMRISLCPYAAPFSRTFRR
jgi:hypothetical protein